jgi:hypothetical protein
MRDEARPGAIMTRGLFVAAMLLAVALVAPPAGSAQPNPAEMSGVPLPVAEMATGTVTVRVIRGSFANPVPSLTVELTDGTATRRATTDDAGRAEFAGLSPDARVTARAVVAGQPLTSQTFTVPASGGMRLVLVATGSEGVARAEDETPPTARRGSVSSATSRVSCSRWARTGCRCSTCCRS